MTQTTKTVNEIKFPFTFTYYLSEEGREKSLLQGGDGREEQKITGEITLADAKRTGHKINANGNITEPNFDFRYGSTKLEYWHTNPAENSKPWAYDKRVFDEPQSFAALLKEYVKLYDERTAVINEAKAEREKLGKEFLADPQAGAEFNYSYSQAYLEGKYKHSFTEGTEVFEQAKQRKDEEIRIAQEKEEKAKAESLAETARREEMKQKQIADWVAEYGDTNQKERFEAGLFPREEAVDAIKDHAFAQLDSRFEQYERVTENDVPCWCDYDSCELECETNSTKTATAEQWETIKSIRQIVPDALEISIREHHCKREKCGSEIKRLGFYVKLQVGGFTFNREYAVNTHSGNLL